MHPRVDGRDFECERRSFKSRGKVLVRRGILAGDKPHAERHFGKFELLVLFEQAIHRKALQDGAFGQSKFANRVNRVDVQNLRLQLSVRDVQFRTHEEIDFQVVLERKRLRKARNLGENRIVFGCVAVKGEGGLRFHVTIGKVRNAQINARRFFRNLRNDPVHPNRRRCFYGVLERTHVLRDRKCANFLIHFFEAAAFACHPGLCAGITFDF